MHRNARQQKILEIITTMEKTQWKSGKNKSRNDGFI